MCYDVCGDKFEVSKEISVMAQRTIHMLFGTLLADKIELSDKNRFLMGSILPDAYSNPTNRKVAHFIKYTSDETTMLLTEDMVEEFVLKYIDILADELHSIRDGHFKLNVLDYKWENKR